LRPSNFLQFLLLCTLCLFPTASAWAEDHWMGIYFNNKKIGFTHTQNTSDSSGKTITSKTFLRMSSEGFDQSTTFTQTTHLDTKGKLIYFSLLQEIMGSRQRIQGQVKGDRFVYRVQGEGFDRERSLSFDPEFFVSANYIEKIVHDGLVVGRKGELSLMTESFQVLNPLKYTVQRKEQLEIQGELRETFVIDQKLSGAESSTWIEPDGKILKETTQNGFVSLWEPEEKATDLGNEIFSVGSFITFSLIKTQHPIKNPRELKSHSFKLFQLSGPNLIPEDQRQKIVLTQQAEDGTYSTIVQVDSESEDPAKKIRLPISRPAFSNYLEDTAQVQSRHAMIRALGRELVKNNRDAWQAAKDINLWVYSNLEKTLVDSTTALDALRNRRGECQSHTYLFAAIARSVGIPTKLVNGLLYSEKDEGFLYHAWPEVYVGEWRALDPTLGQNHVDASHIKLLEEEQTAPLRLMEFIGKIKIEVIEK
jgi:hypothetical protein